MVSTLEKQQRARIFRALSVESRLRIMQLLSRRTLCVGAFSDLLGISAGAVSQHLRVLKDAGLIESERRGFYIHYHVTPGAAGMQRWQSPWALRHCRLLPLQGRNIAAA